MKGKKKYSPKKNSRKTNLSIPSIASEEFRHLVARTDGQSEKFWSAVERVWDWSELRQGGKLYDRIHALDRQFVERGKAHKVCPIVILLNAGTN
jgi:hypothetical protein